MVEISDRKLSYNIIGKENRKLVILVRLKRFIIIIATIFLVLLFIHSIIIPLIYKYSFKVQSAALFLNFVNVPSQADLANPQKYLPMSRNMYLETDDNVTLGVWQILKIEENQNCEKQTDDSIFEHAFLDSTDTMIYFHGNTGSRLLDHRIELYKILRKQFHVITFDYRGFADSTNETPSETKLVKDCEFIYKWVANKTKGSIFVWGHSLGTSLVTHTIFNLHSKIKEPAGVFLEAPITNMADEIVENPIAKIFSFLPWFDYVAIQPMKRNGLTLESDRYICEIDAPIIILHAQDDNVIPIKLGKKLYAAGKKCRRGTAGRIIFHEFQSTCGYKHKYIYRAPEISFIINDFVSLAKKRKQ
ncbi:lysophosphatidylserine lipase ABHD12-like [Diabrotica virgifera virgifera]|uniref:AB hydrolase-1 domain-containing protein n=1 Tax=Diabrotica virgifera virgifera TaxID=50390 RepID=A0ABM5L0E6_DIAVI|nr:lysophosphatidylserine lipase ABHD12-like [Diabrotica virgifera virgifera]